jgi:hypothetical protein
MERIQNEIESSSVIPVNGGDQRCSFVLRGEMNSAKRIKPEICESIENQRVLNKWTTIHSKHKHSNEEL